MDDNKGVGEALDDTSVVRGKHILMFGRTNETKGKMNQIVKI